MAETRISGATVTDMNSIKYKDTAAAGNDFQATFDQSTEEELSWTPEWLIWKGYYDEIPELQSVIDKKAIWTVGKGFEADKKTKAILSRIRGNGKSTFNFIMQNQVRVYTICGDSFAEIIRNKRGELINLKPLPNLKIIANNRGIIKRYELNVIKTSEIGKQETTEVIKFKPENIFHLSWMNLGASIHGIGTIQKLKDIIEARKEAMQDLRVVFHRYVKPLIISYVDTDDESEIKAYKDKMDKAVKLGENMVVPKDVVDHIDRISIPQFSTLDPLPWIKLLQKYFIMSEGVPEIILGAGEEATEASAKMGYLAFQQMVEYNQLFLEEQLKAQLKLDIEFTFPARIDEDLRSDDKKDSPLRGEKKSEVIA